MTAEALKPARRLRLPTLGPDEEMAEALEALDQAQAALVDTLHRHFLGQTVPGEIWRARNQLDLAYRSLHATLVAVTRESPTEEARCP